MDLLTRSHLRKLLDTGDRLCVSVYLPTHRGASEARQDPVRFKNLLHAAKRRLEERDIKSATIRNLIQPAEEWVHELDFWRHQADGLAVFLTEESRERLRLPRRFDEHVSVGDHFYLNPLLPLLQGNGRFYLLAVSQHSCRLFSGNRDAIEQLDEATLPHDLRSALGWWRERELNLHSMQKRPQSRGGDATAVYHGHFEDSTKEDLAAYFRRIDAAVHDVVRDEQAPLVFAGVDYLFPIYRDVNTYDELCDQAVTGNPDDARPEALHRQAWEIVRPLFERRERDVLHEYSDRMSQRRATSDMSLVLRAARDGLVETLIIPRGVELRGHVDSTGDLDVRNAPGEDAEDLLDLAARLTLQASGNVLAVEAEAMPVDATVAALLRSPLSAVAT